jgi:hypothetical protein
MKTVTITALGNTYNKLLIQPNADLTKLITECREKNPQSSYRLPTMNGDYVQLSYDKKLSNLIKYGIPMKVVVKVVSYDFVDAKTNERITGGYLQLVAIIP